MNPTRFNILWADDEIDLLKPHILFLSQKGYDVTPVNSGADALEQFDKKNFDIVFLDENMPGISGLEALMHIKQKKPHVPVVMITKSEEENIMEEAIGAKIDDYLVKPINPNQILASIKKILDQSRLISEKVSHSYRQEFQSISLAFDDALTWQGWIEIYRKLCFWDLQISRTNTKDMLEVLEMQKAEANINFFKFIKNHYVDWLNNPKADRPILSHEVLRKKLFPLLKEESLIFLILIDNLRYDQWKVLEPEIGKMFHIADETMYYSILPTTTSYARNAIFSGMLPSEMEKFHPDLWLNDNDEGGKNLYEEEFLRRQLKMQHIGEVKMNYHKVIHQQQGKEILQHFHNLLLTKFNVIVYNFVDMLSHARTDAGVMRELAPDEAAYRDLTLTWFQHSSLYELLKQLSEKKVKIVMTTDHGTIRVKRPYRIIGDKETNTNLRYKQGRNLSYDKKYVLSAKPEDFHLPRTTVSTTYAFASEDYFFAYPNNYNYYVNFYKDTFQHGGVSLEEMIVPIVTLHSRAL
ncbi:MAG: PglZ domain-containing protein [Cytophagales bacterium]|nr:PglZ domain-containing protein [Cytophagales bacterium]MDW8385009.1 PglZ domain-containing protein [Flammeovirgaceae bacterium]